MTSARYRKDHTSQWLNSLRKQGFKPQTEILAEVRQEDWMFWERHYIKQFRDLGFDLTNGTAGGEGLNNPSQEIRRKMSEAKRGKRQSEESRQSRSLAVRGRKRVDTASGVVGVSWAKNNKKWHAYFNVSGERVWQGHFTKKEDAQFARALAVAAYGKEF